MKQYYKFVLKHLDYAFKYFLSLLTSTYASSLETPKELYFRNWSQWAVMAVCEQFPVIIAGPVKYVAGEPLKVTYWGPIYSHLKIANMSKTAS